VGRASAQQQPWRQPQPALDDDEVGGGGRLAPGSPWGSRPGGGRKWVLWSTSLAVEPPARPGMLAGRVLERHRAAGAASGSRRGPASAPGVGQQAPGAVMRAPCSISLVGRCTM
jgi:hypothetical protein